MKLPTVLVILALVSPVAIHAASVDVKAELARLAQRTTQCPNSGQLCIGAFNIQTFGQAKMDEPEVVAALVEIINAYDIMLIQEIRDADEVAIYELLDECNAANSDPFAMVMSIRLGDSSYKEQYAYFYRASKFEVEDTYQWPDDATDDSASGFYDTFARPPFSVLFRSTTGSQIDRFGFAGIHTQPEEAPNEIDALVDVYDDLVQDWGVEDIIIGGDYNAGCSYVSEEDWDWIRLRTDDRFVWLIGDDANTNVNENSECAYDRMVIAGDNLIAAHVSGSGNVYYFDQDLGLTNDQALEVSDHYPVEMRIN